MKDSVENHQKLLAEMQQHKSALQGRASETAHGYEQ